MPRRGYLVAFILVVVALVIGALFGGRYLLQKLAESQGAAPAWVPPPLLTPGPTPSVAPSEAPATALAVNPGATATDVSTSVPAGPTLPPIPPLAKVLTPFVLPTPTFEPVATAVPVTPTAISVQITSTPALAGDYPFVLTRPIRNSNGDCLGRLILGIITDQNGAPMAGVRLHLTDEYNSVNDIKPSKSEAVDLGRYDFPLFGASRRYFIEVVDGSGQPISQQVEIDHGMGADPGATCHEVDWQKR